MKVLSFNLWGKFGPYEERWGYAADLMPSLHVDILCLQEAGVHEELDRLARKTKTRILLSDVGGTGLAVLSRLGSASNRLIEYETRSPFENYIRKFIAIHMDSGTSEFLLVNTHLSWKKGDEASRESQVRELAGYLKEPSVPVLLCGDFNCEYGSPAMAPLRQAGFMDSLKGTPDDHQPTWDNGNPFIQSHKEKFPDRRIDLILPHPEFLKRFPLKHASIVLKETRRDGLHASDHYGVLAEFL